MKPEGFSKLPFLPGNLEEGSRLVSMSSIYKDYEGDGYILLPPESAMSSEEDFKEWKDRLINSVIDKGLSTEGEVNEKEKR